MTNISALLTGCKKEDARSQRVLFDLFKGRIMGLCRRYTRDREEAKDVMQESFVRIFRNINQLEDPEKLDAWLITIAVNTAINHYHRNKKHRVVSRVNHASEQIPDDAVSMLTDELLIGVINTLPDRCRLVFNMFSIEGYSHAEISAALRITEGTSRSQLNYARELLKEKLKCLNMAHYYEKFA